MNYERLQSVYSKNGYPILPVRTGMLIEVHEKVWEGSTERIWKFRGLVIKTKKENHPDGTFTMRWTCSGVTVEKIYPFSFNKFEKVLLLDEYKVRKSKLYYMRDKIWKDARLKSIISAENRDSDLLKKIKVSEAPKAEEKEVVEEVKQEVVEEKVESPVVETPVEPEAPAVEETPTVEEAPATEEPAAEETPAEPEAPAEEAPATEAAE